MSQMRHSNLRPGQYRFRVIASNNRGSPVTGFFDFSIAPACYQNEWFGASCGVAFVLLPWALYWVRLYQITWEFNAWLDARATPVAYTKDPNKSGRDGGGVKRFRRKTGTHAP